MALVRDPEAAARYAADPAGALAGANLSDVTIADVQNLIPVVADSLAVATPDFGGAADAVNALSANVWTSGAAAAAFDAFGIPSAPPVAEHVVQHVTPQVSVPIGDHPADHAVVAPQDGVLVDVFDQFPVDAGIAEPDPADLPVDVEWQSTDDLPTADHHPVEDAGFDLI